MATSLLNIKLIKDKISHIRTSCSRLKRLIDSGKDQFLSNPDSYAIAEHHLRRSLEALLDIGRHIIAKKGLGIPHDYRSILITLGNHGILQQEYVQKIQGMAGYRNRLVHGYADVTSEELYDLLAEHLTDFEEFAAIILSYIELTE